MPIRLRCRYCGAEFEVSPDDVDVDASVESVDEGGIDVVVSATVKCVRCGRRVLDLSETVRFEPKK